MKSYRVIVPPIAEELIVAQVVHIAEDSIDHALAWEARLRLAVAGIGRTPKGYTVDEAASERMGVEIRKMVFERTYLVFYRVNEAARTIEILNFRHGARLPGPREA